MIIRLAGDSLTHEITSNAELRDNRPPKKRITFLETPSGPRLGTGRVRFEGLYALALHLFADTEAGLYSTYLLTDGAPPFRAHDYDLLAELLVVLFGIADQAQAEAILKNYPVGPCEPPVVWPQERSVPIYHNQAIWPFVTACWVKAAQKAGHPPNR
jgi:hypothetical protein